MVTAATLLPTRGMTAMAAAPLAERMAFAPSGASLEEIDPSIVDAALGAAKAGGASYADINIRSAIREAWGVSGTDLAAPSYQLDISVGVRALVKGYWGFAGLDGVATSDIAARLGGDAAAQAGIAARGAARTVELTPAPVATGTWVMPIGIDPFTVSNEEKYDFLASMNDFAMRLPACVLAQSTMRFLKDEHLFASTEGSLTKQVCYATHATYYVAVVRDWSTERDAGRQAEFLTMAGKGWEYHRSAPFRDEAQRLIDEALRARHKKTADVGRYDVVFDAQAIAGILDRSIGTATELDRAAGYEANGVGTTYLHQPLDMLGTFRVGAPLLNVSANRSMPGGVATVRWDDEGIIPVETTLVKDGVLMDYQTTRESASWLAPYYQRIGTPVRSNGCACALGSAPFTQRNPNLVMHPGAQDLSFEDLVRDTSNGIAVVGGETMMDHQVLNGYGTGAQMFEIRDGKLGAALTQAQFLYRAPELWRNVVAIGGARSVEHFGFERWRDSNRFRTGHTVSAVPAKVTGIAIIDPSRRI
jgi:TldD protein